MFSSIEVVLRYMSYAIFRRGINIAFCNDFNAQYLKNYPSEQSHFLKYGLAYVSFAKDEPHLFDAIIQYESFSMADIRRDIPDELSFVIESVATLSKISVTQAQKLFYHVWIYTHGLACFACKGSLFLSKEEIKYLLEVAYQSFLSHLSQENTGDCDE